MPTNDKRRAAKRKPPGAETASVKQPPRKGNTPSASAQPTYYDYTNEAGEPVYRVRRAAGKRFSQERHVGNGKYQRGMQGVERVLYHAPELAKAVSATRRKVIYVVEGERDADSLKALGLTATTNPGGAGKWRDEYSIMLMGAKRVNLVWDNDAPDAKTHKRKGQDHALQVEQSLRKYGIAVRMLRARSGKDATDHLAAGHSVDELVEERPGEALPVEGQDAPVGAVASTHSASGQLPAAYQLAVARLAEHAAANRLPLPRAHGDELGYDACCPVHDDHDPSLSLRVGEQHPVLVKCHAQDCTYAEVARALGINPREFSAPRATDGGAQTGSWEVLGIRDAVRIAEEPFDEVVPHLLAAGEKAVIAGPPKQLKTWLALHLVRCVACGEAVFQDELWLPPAQSVVFVQEEGARQRWASRVARTFEDQPEAPFKYLHRVRFSLASRDDVARLTEKALELQARVIVVDPWQRVTSGMKESDAAETGPAWDAVHGLATDTGAALVVLHHTRKDADLSIDALRGSSRMAGEVDLLVVMKKVGNGRLEINMDGREFVRPDFEDGNLSVVYGEPPWQMRHDGFVQAKGKRTVNDGVVEVLAAARGTYVTTVAVHGRVQAALGRECTKAAVQKELKALWEAKVIARRHPKDDTQGFEWCIQ